METAWSLMTTTSHQASLPPGMMLVYMWSSTRTNLLHKDLHHVPLLWCMDVNNLLYLLPLSPSCTTPSLTILLCPWLPLLFHASFEDYCLLMMLSPSFPSLVFIPLPCLLLEPHLCVSFIYTLSILMHPIWMSAFGWQTTDCSCVTG